MLKNCRGTLVSQMNVYIDMGLQLKVRIDMLITDCRRLVGMM